MKKFLYAYIVVISTVLFTACGGSNSSNNSGSLPAGPQAFTLEEKQFVHSLFTTEYLWFDEVASDINYDLYATPQYLVDGLKAPQDQWSFAITAQEYENVVNQETAGFGFRYNLDMVISSVRINSPAYMNLSRGDKILLINGQEANYNTIASAGQNLNTPSTFTVLRAGQQLDISVTPRTYHYAVTLGKVFPSGVGYMRYDEFTGSSVQEFENEFSKFKNAGIHDLVIDLRYNSGGSVDVASTLLDNITNRFPGQRQAYLDWNVNYKNKNADYYFSSEIEANDLDMTRVVFLTTANTASASEMVISALKPYLGAANVITVGSATHGKPVGMEGRSYGSNYYFLINFYVRNNMGETTSFNGIAVTCSAPDDLSHQLGDPEEAMLKSALNYISTGSCL